MITILNNDLHNGLKIAINRPSNLKQVYHLIKNIISKLSILLSI